MNKKTKNLEVELEQEDWELEKRMNNRTKSLRSQTVQHEDWELEKWTSNRTKNEQEDHELKKSNYNKKTKSLKKKKIKRLGAWEKREQEDTWVGKEKEQKD